MCHLSRVKCHMSHVHRPFPSYSSIIHFRLIHTRLAPKPKSFGLQRQTDRRTLRIVDWGPIGRKLDYQFHNFFLFNCKRALFVTKNYDKHLIICSSFDGNVGATRLRQSLLFPCYSTLPVDPIVEGSKEIFLSISVWRFIWLIFWGYEVWIFHWWVEKSDLKCSTN